MQLIVINHLTALINMLTHMHLFILNGFSKDVLFMFESLN